MTVSTTTSRISYSGNGITTVFSVPFKFLANTDLVVVEVNNTTGVETTKTITTHYTVSGAGDDAGGSVVMLTAPATGTTLVIYREMTYTQETDYVTGENFPAETHETALDRVTMLAQQNQDVSDRSLRVSEATTGFNGELPNLTGRGGQYLKLKADLSGIDTATPTGAGGSGLVDVAGITALAAIDITGLADDDVYYLTYRSTAGDGGHGVMRWDDSNLSSQVTNDPQKGVYVPPASDTTGASGCWVRQHQGVLNVQWFGAKGDGVTDDTTSFVATINYVKGMTVSGNTVIRCVGDFVINPSSFDFTSFTAVDTLTFEVNGKLRLQSTLKLPGNTHLIGVGGSDATVQFTRGPCCQIIPPAAADGIWLLGANGQRVENVAMYGPSGHTGIVVTGLTAASPPGGVTALKDLRNVNILAGDAANSYALEIDASFWVWSQNCSFLSQSNSSGSVKIHNSGAAGSESGLIYFRDLLIATKGVYITTTTGNNRGGNVFFDWCHAESMVEPAVNITPASGAPIMNITLNQFQLSDAVSSTVLLAVSGKAGETRDVRIVSSELPEITGQNLIKGLRLECLNQYYLSASSERNPHNPWQSVDVEGEHRGRVGNQGQEFGLKPQFPFTSVLSEVVAGTLTQTTGQNAPDGSTLAVRISNSSGSLATYHAHNGNVTHAVGDMLLVGVWLRPDADDESIYVDGAAPGPTLTAAAGVFDTSTTEWWGAASASQTGVISDHRFDVGGPWALHWGAAVFASAATTACYFGVNIPDGGALYKFAPFAVKIPAAYVSAITKQELVRIVNTVTAFNPSAPAGSVALQQHQTMYLNSAWDSGHLVMGAYHLWVDATGDLRIKSGAPASDTDGTVVGAQT